MRAKTAVLDSTAWIYGRWGTEKVTCYVDSRGFPVVKPLLVVQHGDSKFSCERIEIKFDYWGMLKLLLASLPSVLWVNVACKLKRKA